MAAAKKELVYEFSANYGPMTKEMAAGTKALAAQRSELARLEQQQQRAQEQTQRTQRQAMTELGRGLATFGAATIVGLGLATRAAMSWESAWTGVRKTVDGSDADLAQLEGQLRSLARTLPATHEQIAAVAEAAGQLGIKRQDIAEFTKVMIDMANTTDLTADAAASGMAKFSNIMGTTAKDVDRLGATIVALGNDGASTEADILAMGLRIAGAGRQVGLSAPQVLAFSSALSSVGINAEAGGSSFSTAIVKMSVAAHSGGETLDEFGRVAGMSGEQFATKFGTDAAGAISDFLTGLNHMAASGQNVFGVLDQLGLSEIRVRDALLRSSGAADMFNHTLQVGTSAWAENTALVNEAEKRYQTSASKLQVAGNQIKDAMIDVGASLAPVVSGFATGLADIVAWWQKLPGPIKDVVTWIGVAAGGVALLGGAALIAVPKVLAFRESMTALATGGGAATTALGKFGLFVSSGPFALGLTAATVLLGIFAMKSADGAAKQQQLRDAAKGVADAIGEQNGEINQSVIKAAAKAAADQGLLSTAKNLGIETDKVTDAILGQGTAYDDLMRQLTGMAQTSADVNGAQDSQTLTIIELIGKLKSLHDGTTDQIQANRDTVDAVSGATEAQKQQAAATERQAKAAEAAVKALDDLIKAMDEVNGVALSARAAQRDYLQQVADTAEVLKKNGRNLDINTKAGRDNQASVDDLVKSTNSLADAAAAEAEKHGGATAKFAAYRASMIATRPEIIKAAEAMGMLPAEAEKFADAVHRIPDAAEVAVSVQGADVAVTELEGVRDRVKGIPPGRMVNIGVISEAAQKLLRDLGFQVTALPDGEVQVIAQTAAAQQHLNDWITANQGRTITVVGVYRGPSLSTQEQRYTSVYGAYGMVAHHYAHGGVENHSPQIVRAQPNTMRVWAEPDTGAESYIPWALDRRKQATSVLGFTANGFGMDLVPRSQGVPAAGSGGSPVMVSVYIDGQEFRGMVQTTVDESNRQLRRALGAGSGLNR